MLRHAPIALTLAASLLIGGPVSAATDQPAASPATAAPAPAAAPAPVGGAALTDATPTTAADAAATAPTAVVPPATVVVPPPAVVHSNPPRLPPKGTPMIVAGVSITAGVYLFTSLAGVIAIDKANDRRDSYVDNPLLPDAERPPHERQRRRGRSLLVPIAGPFLAMRHSETALQSYGLAVAGTLQAAGLAIAIVGAVRNGKRRRAKRTSLTANGLSFKF